MKSAFVNVSELISYKEYEKIKNFILEKGDRKTYRNYDNNNPHYKFESFDVYLGADAGQRNINNDPSLSDFNQLTIVDWNSKVIYYDLIIVRAGDLQSKKTRMINGMKEGEVYLVDVYQKGLTTMKNELPKYIEAIGQAMKKY